MELSHTARKWGKKPAKMMKAAQTRKETDRWKRQIAKWVGRKMGGGWREEDPPPPLGFDSSRRQRLMIPSKTRSVGNPQHYTHSQWRSNTHTAASTSPHTHTHHTANISTQNTPWTLDTNRSLRQQTWGENMQMKTHTHTENMPKP